MANDRIYLVCRSCNQAMALWKQYPSGGYAPPAEPGPYQGILGRFITHHLEAHDLECSDSFGPDAPFYTATESSSTPITLWKDPDGASTEIDTIIAAADQMAAGIRRLHGYSVLKTSHFVTLDQLEAAYRQARMRLSEERTPDD